MCSLLKVVFNGGFLQYSIERMNTGPEMNVRCVDLLKNWEVHGYSPAGRSVLRKTVLETEGTVFPDTGRLRLMNNTFFFLKLNEILSKKNPNDLVEGCSNGKIFHKLNNFWASMW